jgi:O-antigen ligase
MRRITFWLAVALTFIVPWEDSISVAALGSLARLMGLVLAAFWAATVLVEGQFRKPHLFHVLVLLFFLWNFVSVFWTPNTSDTIQRIKTYSQIFLLLLIYWDVFQAPKELIAGIQAYVFGAYVLIVNTIYNYVQGNVSVAYEGRYSATGVNAVDMALVLMLGLPAAMQLFFSNEKNQHGTLLQIVNLAYIPLAIFAILLTGSRTSLIAVIPFGLYLVGTRQIKPKTKLLVVSILLVSLLALIPFIPSTVVSRLSTLGSSIESRDLGGRFELWVEALQVFSAHPISGLGSGALDSAIGSAAHNTFVSVLAETGVVGFILFLLILAIVIVQAVNVPNGNAGLWIAIFLTWAIGVFSLSWEFRKLTWLFLSFIVIEGNFTYDQLHIPQPVIRISRSIRQLPHVDETSSD